MIKVIYLQSRCKIETLVFLTLILLLQGPWGTTLHSTLPSERNQGTVYEKMLKKLLRGLSGKSGGKRKLVEGMEAVIKYFKNCNVEERLDSFFFFFLMTPREIKGLLVEDTEL